VEEQERCQCKGEGAGVGGVDGRGRECSAGRTMVGEPPGGEAIIESYDGNS